MESFKGSLTSRYPAALYLCTIFIIREGEDLSNNWTFEGAKENFRDFPHYYDPTPGCVAFSFEYAHSCEFSNSELRACDGVGMTIGAGCFQTLIQGN